MATKLNPYISFRDNAKEAAEFYHSVFGGELEINTFGDTPGMADTSEAELVMHASIVTPGGLTLFLADTPEHVEQSPGGGNIQISLSGDDEAELRGYFDGLSAGGTPGVPLEKVPWGDTFGMFTDKFGIAWMVNILGS
ncbi:PhnB protein [Aeromicrobium panaciterrae]|uniref:PhnB protein n=1 Tax=Aeromicrobium panaciterrae TaxID=363861 RepID=A0ABU1ULJ8_9ACTN|nr:VOC family protein [Aeromicrobium panaciterrae]MDR7086063.1 PhnB protein [Aeromicrobium panaciterrae]